MGSLLGGGLLLVVTILEASRSGDAQGAASWVVAATAIGGLLGGLTGTIWGVAAAIVTLRRCALVEHSILDAADVARHVVLVVVPLHVVLVALVRPSFDGLAAAVASGLLGCGPLSALVRRQVRREQLQDLAVTVR